MELNEKNELIEKINSFDDTDNSIIEEFSHYHPYEVYEVLKELSIDKLDFIYSLFSDEELSLFFEQYDDDFALEELSRLQPKKASSILEFMEVDDASNFLRLFDEDIRARFLKYMNKDQASVLKKLLSYEEDTVGSLFNPDFIKVSKDLTIKEASKILVKEADEVECIDYVYVLDNKKLIGVLSLRELLIADNSDIVENVMINSVKVAHTFDKSESVVYQMQDYDLTALPVLNDKEDMVGIITVDDVIDIVSDAKEEDLSKFAAIGGDIDDLDKSPFVSIKKRIPWLLFLLFIGIFTSSIIASFEDTISKVAILAVFLPLVLDMSGNVGTQSLATTIRLLSSNQLDEKNEIKKHLFREFGIGLLNGICVSIVMVGIVFLFLSIKQENYETLDILKISSTIGVSLIVSLIVTNVLGAFIPILLSKFKVDPASASGPFITTLSDIISLFIYFGLATILLL